MTNKNNKNFGRNLHILVLWVLESPWRGLSSRNLGITPKCEAIWSLIPILWVNCRSNSGFVPILYKKGSDGKTLYQITLLYECKLNAFAYNAESFVIAIISSLCTSLQQIWTDWPKLLVEFSTFLQTSVAQFGHTGETLCNKLCTAI